MLLERLLDLQDRGVIVLTREGQVRRMTVKARRWLVDYFVESEGCRDRLPERLTRWMNQQPAILAKERKDAVPSKPFVMEKGGKHLVVRLASEFGHLVLILEERRTSLEPTLLRPLGLTPRETEVLVWVAQGKTNSDIARILGGSPRTIATHLQHIYHKLGVETRIAAVMRALSFVSDQQM